MDMDMDLLNLDAVFPTNVRTTLLTHLKLVSERLPPGSYDALSYLFNYEDAKAEEVLKQYKYHAIKAEEELYAWFDEDHARALQYLANLGFKESEWKIGLSGQPLPIGEEPSREVDTDAEADVGKGKRSSVVPAEQLAQEFDRKIKKPAPFYKRPNPGGKPNSVESLLWTAWYLFTHRGWSVVRWMLVL